MRLPILALVLILGTSCAATPVVEILPIPLEPLPEFTKLAPPPKCMEWDADTGICQAWKVTRKQFEQLDRRDAEKDGYIAWLRHKIQRHNAEAAK